MTDSGSFLVLDASFKFLYPVVQVDDNVIARSSSSSDVILPEGNSAFAWRTKDLTGFLTASGTQFAHFSSVVDATPAFFAREFEWKVVR